MKLKCGFEVTFKYMRFLYNVNQSTVSTGKDTQTAWRHKWLTVVLLGREGF